MTIVETTRSVTAGADTHADVHVAAVVDRLGGVLGRSVRNDRGRLPPADGWLRSHRRVELAAWKAPAPMWLG